ncbi:unnamed protein product (macronuclear) [Paramecium tetraurelia]|uniref:Uncharacterized protein n=1 Tax=Paramecium tetraurelia TaxID=5888 RepID=A0D1I2_PARTE|nr:uncharacterized protein GSPATT00012423001 [Paramecium tetraurelia]CAK76899.1 unnamed protein product [Paramecium tetraurelia]|eukprot:XP_001444296.1 hypothetical protein (macronuclear) [Paramecium tetraurelia strain d4-2]
MNHGVFQHKFDKQKQRTITLIQKLEKDQRQLDKIKQRNILRVERLMSLNQKDLNTVCNSSLSTDHKNEIKFSLQSRKNTFQIKLESLEESFVFQKIDTNNQSRNYWY